MTLSTPAYQQIEGFLHDLYEYKDVHVYGRQVQGRTEIPRREP